MKDFGFVKFENVHNVEKHIIKDGFYYLCHLDATYKGQQKEYSLPYAVYGPGIEETSKWVWEQVELGNFTGSITLVDDRLDIDDVSDE